MFLNLPLRATGMSWALIWALSTLLLIALVKPLAAIWLRRRANGIMLMPRAFAETWHEECQTTAGEALWQRSQVSQKLQSCDLQTHCSESKVRWTGYSDWRFKAHPFKNGTHG